MPLELALSPVLAPALTGLSAIATLKGALVTWDALNDNSLFAVEVWAAATNDRSTATLLKTATANYYLHTGLPSGATRYYWVRAKNTHGRTDGAWTPVSATAGVSATTLLAQTADMALNSTTVISIAQSLAAVTQTVYSTYENAFFFSFIGGGNTHLFDMQNYSNFDVATIGTSGSAYSQQRFGVTEHTLYSTGTVAVTNASAIVTGTGTAWLSGTVAGQTFIAPNNVRHTILSVDTDTQITLSVAYAGTTQSGQAYSVITASTELFSFAQITSRYTIVGTQLLTVGGEAFRYRLPFNAAAGKLYDCQLLWALVRDNTTWAVTQTTVQRILILEEIKR